MATTNITYVVPGTSDGRWHYYRGTFDANTGIRALYIDGMLVARETGNSKYTLAPNEHLCIGGKDSAPGNNFGFFSSFEIYDVRIYNYALPSETMPVPLLDGKIVPVANGGRLVINWSWGRLLAATNPAGPWVPVVAAPPYTNDLTAAPSMFFKVVYP